MNYVTAFFAGAFVCNAIPHLVAGLQGAPFPTPFAKPSGVANSPPVVNFLWGSFNLAVCLALLAWQPVPLGANLPCLAMALGALAMGVFTALHFGKVRGR